MIEPVYLVVSTSPNISSPPDAAVESLERKGLSLPKIYNHESNAYGFK